MSKETARLLFNRQLGEMRPMLHRYCARMAGSAVDGEDIVQETLIKAVEAFGRGPIDNLQGWLFRIAHNASMDFLRRRRRQEAVHSEEDPDMIADESASAAARYAASTALRTFMQLPTAQRGTVILMDVLGYSLHEVGEITGLTVPAVKAALHRGRVRIRELAERPGEPVVWSEGELARLSAYAERFNAHDFDAVRTMLADDVALELVSRKRAAGFKEVSRYFSNYAGIGDWQLRPGLADGRPALLVLDTAAPDAPPSYFVLVEWKDGQIIRIRDFRYARYVADSAELLILQQTKNGGQQ